MNTYIHYYYSVVAPDIDLRTFLEYMGKSPGNDLELLSVNDLHIQRDLMAVLDNNHPWYFLVQWILHNGGDNLLNILQQLTPDMLEQMEDEMDTKVLKITPYAASLGSCIDHVRSYRRGADDYIDADLTLGGEVLLLAPKPRLPKGYITSINRLNQYNKMPENPLIEETLEWIINIPSLTYQIYGGDLVDYSVIATLIASLGVHSDHLNSIQGVIIVNDFYYHTTMIINRIAPSSNIAVHMSLRQTSAIPQLIRNEMTSHEFNPARILTETLRAGLLDVTSKVTWISLLTELPVFPNLIVYRIKPSTSYLTIYQEISELISVLNTPKATNTLTIIEFNTTLLSRIGGILSALQYVCFNVHIIRLPIDHVFKRLWIITYGLNHQDVQLKSKISTNPMPSTAQEIANFHREYNKRTSVWLTVNHETIVTAEAIIARTNNVIPGLPSNCERYLATSLIVTSQLLHHGEDPIQLLHKINFQVNKELTQKRMDFTRYRPEGRGSITADTTLRHKIEILRRLMLLEYMHFQVASINVETYNLVEVEQQLPPFADFIQLMDSRTAS